MPEPTGQCRVCRRNYRLRGDGTIRSHNRGWDRCAGAWLSPRTSRKRPRPKDEPMTDSTPRLRLTRDDLTLMTLRATTASTYDEHHWVGRDALALVGEAALLMSDRDRLAARVAEVEAEMRQLLTGSAPRSLALALACVTCHTCVGVFVTQDALDRWARTNGWHDGRCPDCSTTEGA